MPVADGDDVLAAVPVSVCEADRVVDGLGVTALEGVLEEDAPTITARGVAVSDVVALGLEELEPVSVAENEAVALGVTVVLKDCVELGVPELVTVDVTVGDEDGV